MSANPFLKAAKPLQIALAGGGIGGLCAALCLARAGHQISVFEQTPTFIETGAGVQVSANASRVLHALNLQQPLADAAFLPQATQIRSWRSGRVISQTPLGDTARQRYGAPYYHIHRGDLLQLLADAAIAQPNVQLRLGSRIDAFEQDPDGVRVNVRDQATTFDLLIGADGIHSRVREVLWGRQQADFTGNMAWRMLVPLEHMPPDLIAPNATVWWGPGKHFVHYLVDGGHQVNCVCVVETPTWHAESWVERGSMDQLQADFAGWHSTVGQLLRQADESSLFKWGLFDRAPMPQWGIGCVTLLGDACHPTLPFMAQGAAMAIEDAAVLTNCLSADTDLSRALQRYENLRKPRTARIQRGSRRNAKVFHLSGVAAWLRDRAASRAGQNAMEQLYRYDPMSDGITAG